MLRWLLPVVAVMTLLGSSVTTWAAAGVIGDASCCCPVKAKCKCHDHDRDSDPTPKLERCGGKAELVTPAIAPVEIATVPQIATDVRVAVVATVSREPIPDEYTIEPETPPF